MRSCFPIHLHLRRLLLSSAHSFSLQVLVLEQHDQAGGCCHTFSEKGYEFDVGKQLGVGDYVDYVFVIKRRTPRAKFLWATELPTVEIKHRPSTRREICANSKTNHLCHSFRPALLRLQKIRPHADFPVVSCFLVMSLWGYVSRCGPLLLHCKLVGSQLGKFS